MKKKFIILTCLVFLISTRFYGQEKVLMKFDSEFDPGSVHTENVVKSVIRCTGSDPERRYENELLLANFLGQS